MAGKAPLITRSKCPQPPECRSLLVSLDPGQHQSVSASLIAGNLRVTVVLICICVIFREAADPSSGLLTTEGRLLL